MFATTYPLLDAIFSMLAFFLFILWIWIVITVFIDVFRSHMSGWAKAGWFILIIVLPFLGVLVYLVARGGKMRERAIEDAQEQDAAFRSYVKDAAGGGGAEEVAKLAELRDKGVISEAEFQQGKAKALGG